MDFTTENNTVTPTPVTPQTPAPTPQIVVQPTPTAPIAQEPVTAQPVHTPIQTQAIPASQTAVPIQPMQPIQTQPVMPAPIAPIMQTATPAPAPVATQPVSAPAQSQIQPQVQAQAQPMAVPIPQQTAPVTANATPNPAPAPEQEEYTEENGEEKAEEKKPAKLILNIQRILDDWKFERGKVLIFLMKLMKVLVVLGAISLFFMGFIGVIGMNIAISFLEPVAFLTRNAFTSQIMLLCATFLTVWVSFANKLTPYFKAFSIAKWLKNNEVDPKEVMKIYLQTRREKELTKYKKGRGAISAEKADLSQAAFILLNEDNKKSYKTEMVWALVFWFLISAAKVAFVYFFSIVLSNICQQINEIIQKTAEFDFMKLVNFALNPIFLGVIGGWILLGIIGAIVLVSIAHARNKNQQKWIKAYMKADMPSEEYYDEE